MKKFNIIFTKLISVTLVTVLLTALIRSIFLSNWVFVGLYIFILLAFQSIESIQKQIELQEKTEDLFSSFKDLQNTLDDFEDLNNTDNEERNDDK